MSVNKRDLHIFDIGGNKYRLIVAIHYKSQMVFIRHVLTHADYDAGDGGRTMKSRTIVRAIKDPAALGHLLHRVPRTNTTGRWPT